MANDNHIRKNANVPTKTAEMIGMGMGKKKGHGENGKKGHEFSDW
jgi:hypothetical protein